VIATLDKVFTFIVPDTVTGWPTARPVVDVHENVPLDPVIATLAKVVSATDPETVTAWPTYKPVVDVHEKVPLVPVTATEERFLLPRDPATETVWPTYNPLVLEQENVPLVPVTATVLNVGLTKLVLTTLVEAGMPVPVTVWPAPINVSVCDMVTLTVELR
jgi:hypothetical protein